MIEEILQEKKRQCPPWVPQLPGDDTLIACLETQIETLPNTTEKRATYKRIAAIAMLGMENHEIDGLLGLKKVLDNYIRPSFLEVPEQSFFDLEKGNILINIRKKQKLCGIASGIGPLRQVHHFDLIEVEPGEVISVSYRSVVKVVLSTVPCF
jgi:hypothetical protein